MRIIRAHAIGILLVVLAGTAGCESRVTLTDPRRPERVYAVSSGSGVTVYWENIPGASGYRVYRRDSPADDYELAEETSVTDSQLAIDGLQVFVAVTALRGNAESAKSPDVVGLRQPDHLSAFPVLALTSTAAGFGTAIESAGDLDGDGREEVLIGAPGALGGDGAVYLFRGTASGLESIPEATLPGAAGSAFGTSIAYSSSAMAGEPAIAIGAPGGSGAVRMYKPATDPLLESLGSLPVPAIAMNASFGALVVAAGNLDGLVPVHEEFAVSAPAAAGGEGRVVLYRGAAASNPLVTPLVVRMSTPDAGAGFGRALAAAGNLETDPADDLLIGAPTHSFTGGVAVLHGSVDLFAVGSTSATVEIEYSGTDVGGGHFGATLASIGDADSDDRDEIVIGAPNDDCDGLAEGAGSVTVFNPGAEGEIDGTLCGDGQDVHLGSALVFAGSVLDDGNEHFLMGSMDPASGNGSWTTARSVFSANETPPDSLETFAPENSAGPGFGRVLASADVNGDGRNDVLVGVPESSTVHLYVTLPAHGPEVLLGGPIDATADTVVTLPDAFIADLTGTTYDCLVEWGDGTALDLQPCTSGTLRAFEHAYSIDDPEGDGHQDFFVSVFVYAGDGRSGMGVTRVRVRP